MRIALIIQVSEVLLSLKNGKNGHAAVGHWKTPQSTNITVNSLLFFPNKNPCRKGKAVHDGNTNKYCRKTAVGAENLNALL